MSDTILIGTVTLGVTEITVPPTGAVIAGLDNRVVTLLSTSLTGDIAALANAAAASALLATAPISTAIGMLILPSYVSDHPGTLTKGMPVCLINGLLRRATSHAPYNTPIGLIFEEEILQGMSGRVQTDTNLTTTTSAWDLATGMVGGLSPGQTYFISAAGCITPFAPAEAGEYVTPIGLALSSTTLRISFNFSTLR